MNKSEIKIAKINSLDELGPRLQETAQITYIRAFSKIPYLELFSGDEALEAMQYILNKNGDLLIGQKEDSVVSLAGGYMRDETYYIEELAVKPEEQGKGIGKQTLLELLNLGGKRNPKRYELRTNVDNARALSLYEQVGFAKLPTTIVVPKQRVDGRPALDERIYLAKGEPMKEQSQLRRVIIAYPSGNTTALVFDQRLADDRPELTKKIMSAWTNSTEIEQCGFITLPKDSRAIGRLQMFGNEFCGNGGRSAVWAITGGKDGDGLIEVSGADQPLKYSIKQGLVTLEMPLPKNKSQLVRVVPEGTLVKLNGISQLVVTEASNISPRELLLKLYRENSYGLADELAFGVTYYNPTTGKAKFCVKVAGNDTIFDETACGSGTCASGIAMAVKEGKSQNLDIIQPSGEVISSHAIYQGKTITYSSITGSVKVLYDGPLSI